MLDMNQSERTFTAKHQHSVDDIVDFNTLWKNDVGTNKVIVFKLPDAVRIKKTAEYQGANMATPSLQIGDDSAASVQKTPWRVSLASMKKQVAKVEYLYPETLPHMTIAVLTLHNGYALQGMSAPADPTNFDAEKGKEFAYEDAIRKMWSLEAYLMREYLHGSITVDPRRWE